MICKNATIKKCKESDKKTEKDIWCLYSKDGKKLLGRHPTKEAAQKQLAAVEIHKSGAKHLSKITNYLFLFEE